jgi:hypothetical protein
MSEKDNSFQIKKKGIKVRKEDKKRNCLEIEKKNCSWFDVGITACPPFRETKDYCTVHERLTIIIWELKEQQ